MILPEHLTLSSFPEDAHTISISDAAWERIATNRDYLDAILKNGATYYGINTGFGSLCNVRIAPEELSLLQENLVCSHACGMGDEVPVEL